MSGAQGVTVRAHAHETLDALAWRQLGTTAGHVEATLAANPGLAKLAADLPEGQAVRLVNAPEPTRPMVHLWD
ncbi:tail protein X [Acidovorax sp. Leaf160]|uniref:tail protein X n=1 Tax=Acidovorax sp. Leaf160 TaxID=1736280 RepID=UPI0006F6F93C|nr:tail protein X [Acidovorax sp. Leaf160]KQR50159.1 phage tail protein [Acidovorax sp. Leaf160]